MINQNTGFIKIGRFAQNTYEEYIDAFVKLKAKGMKDLIVDLRGNPGGFLNVATKICDEFLDENKLIVYTEGRSRPREDFYATSKGDFEKNKIVILIDEGSASASEILAGALQDNDRGIIVGRRSFGKGLVQEQSDFSDGSAIRLTIARYYTPTGRCIQKPYVPGQLEDYEMEEIHRYRSGELSSKDSIKFADSLKFKTPKGKIVYGGGGIMPDIFVPIDTTKNSGYLSQLYLNGIISQFTMSYVDKNRNTLTAYGNYDSFINEFSISEQLIKELVVYAEKEKVKPNERDLKRSLPIIKSQLKAYIARNIWRNDAFYKVLSLEDAMVKEALKALEQSK
jgi:carboxyl-terminal processing protease